MEIKKYLFILLVLLTGCSETKQEQIKEIFSLLNKKNQKERIVSRGDLETIGYPIVKIITNGLIKKTYLLPITQRNGYTNYVSGNGQSITTNKLSLIRTNGFDIYLISAYSSEQIKIEKIQKKEKLKYKKFYEYLTPSFGSESFVLECMSMLKEKERIEIMNVKYYLNKVEETCINEKTTFLNYYWFDEDNYFWKTTQTLPKNHITVDLESVIK
tara:strand:+ start:683 stop:1324 length:642 start_codon:yes stop_codon:yes gene_type:complete